MKPVYLASGGQEHMYRVGALARVNAADRFGTPLAQRELEEVREAFGRPCHRAVAHIRARVAELLYACEKAGALLADPEIRGEHRVPVTFREGRGVAHVEAPRGALFHDYEIDGRGIVRQANLLVATQQNYAAINTSIRQAAGAFVSGKGDGALLNAVEFAIRCYDPCLSCATHAAGRMPLVVEVRRGDGTLRRVGR
jgi:F420-non-reducing hydrogenase large subunit